jgi:glycosyltransferase involved in cell wall biosynthesis
MKVLHLMSCRGWSSDAYWAASITAALERDGHDAMLVCKRGSDERVVARAREAGVHSIDTLAFEHPVDLADLRRLRRWMAEADVLHVHRGEEHWLAAAANRVAASPRPIVRTRHIAQAVRPHALNRWLYARATSFVITVSEAIRRQYLAAELVDAARIVALPGGVSVERFHPAVDGAGYRAALGLEEDVVLLGLVGGLRVMKGQELALAAIARLLEAGRRLHLVLIGAGAFEPAIRRAIGAARLDRHVTMAGFVADLPAAIAALDVALYPALESEGMSRVVFEYLAMGKAVVAARVGVVPEVLEDRRTALLVPAEEVDALVRAIGELLDDASLRARLGSAAADLVGARLSSAAIARELGSLYASLGVPDRGRP